MDGKAWNGQTVGGFRISSKVGDGFGGELFDAEQAERARPAQIKLITPSLAASPGFAARFAHDSALLGSFFHPNVTTLYLAGTDAGTSFLAMRPVGGRPLDVLIAEEGPVDLRRAVALIAGAAAALDEGHRRGLVHRGLAPSSITVSRRGGSEQASVTDYAVADDTSEYGGLLSPPAGTAPPRPDYAAPEQIRGEPAVPASDVYALGAILFHALTGRPPFADRPYEATLDGHLHEQVPSACALVAHLPTSVDVILSRALAKHPSERFASAAELAAAFPTKPRLLAAWRSMLAAGTMAPAPEAPATEAEVVPAPAQPTASQAGATPEGDTVVAAGSPSTVRLAAERPTEPPAASAPDGREASHPVSRDARASAADAPDQPPEDPGDTSAAEDQPAYDPPMLETIVAEGTPRPGRRRRASLALVVAVSLLAASSVGVLAAAGVFDAEGDGPSGNGPGVVQPAPAASTAPAATPLPRAGGPEPRRARPRAPERSPGRERRPAARRKDRTPTEKRRSWPAGRSAYTAVIFTSPTDRATALAKARAASELGLRAGVLRSGNFSNLQPGVWVTFAGLSSSARTAERALARIRRAGIASRPYVRYIRIR